MHLFETLGTAQAAAGAARQIAPPFLEPEFARAGNFHTNFDTQRRLLNLNVVQLGCFGQQSLSQTESEREIIEVGRCGQHDRMRDTVEDERYRHLIGKPVVRALGPTATMRRNRRFAGSGWTQLGIVGFQLRT